MVRVVYVIVGNIVGVILGLLVAAILAICHVGLVSIAWGVLVYVIFLIVGIALTFVDPFKLDD